MTRLEAARTRMKQNVFADNMGAIPIVVEPDHTVYELEINETHMNPYNIVHGGVYCTLADTAAGAAAYTDGRSYVTQNCNFSFLHSQSHGKLRADARVRHRGNSSCLIEVNISGEDEKLLFTGLITFFHVDRKRYLNQE